MSDCRHYTDTSDESSSINLYEALEDDQMTSFVINDIQQQIKHSSPCLGSPNKDLKSVSSQKSTLISTSIATLLDVENHAKQTAQNLDRILLELKGSLHGMSGLTVECIETYNSSIAKTCDSVDATIKNTYQIMAKFEELGQHLRPLPKLAQQIKEIRRVLDIFENHLHNANS